MPLRFLLFAAAALLALILASAPSGAQEEPPYYEIPTPEPSPTVSPTASPTPDDGTGPVRIEMRNRGKRSFFTGPETVSQNEPLTILNTSKPRRVGPHTFTLVRPGLIPRTKRQRRICLLCSRISRAHRYHPKSGRVARPTLESGRPGWNLAFGRAGDSWYVERRGRSQTRRVRAPVGRLLTYFCGVHPRMKGTIRVVE